jgi:predicted transcriptional regulator
MISIYNFIGSWQLFPEKGIYETGSRPKSGICIITANNDKQSVSINTNWVTLENQAFAAQYELATDGAVHNFADTDLADTVKVDIISTIHFEVFFYKNEIEVLQVTHELLPNGYLKIIQKGSTPEQKPYINTEVYHRQMSVLPYASSASGALVKPTEEGVIRHKALSAMEEQTNMQLDQIRRQIELLALQAQEIQMRKELSMIIYNAKLSFSPVIGSIYYLYQKDDDTHFVSMVGPDQWGRGKAYKEFIAKVKLLADHTWVEV